MESREAQISAIAALDEPTRRQLYDYVVGQPTPVSRDDAATAFDLPRTTAAFTSTGSPTRAYSTSSTNAAPAAPAPAPDAPPSSTNDRTSR